MRKYARVRVPLRDFAHDCTKQKCKITNTDDMHNSWKKTGKLNTNKSFHWDGLTTGAIDAPFATSPSSWCNHCRRRERLQNTPQPQTTSFQCVGTLYWTSRKTIGTILIQLDANELRGILQSSQRLKYLPDKDKSLLFLLECRMLIHFDLQLKWADHFSIHVRHANYFNIILKCLKGI